MFSSQLYQKRFDGAKLLLFAEMSKKLWSTFAKCKTQ